MAEYRGDSGAYLSNGQQQQRHAHVPQVTVTAAATSPTEESAAALRRPLNLGIATAAANSAARAAAAAAQRPPGMQQHQQQYNGNGNGNNGAPPQQSRVQQKLQRNNNSGPPSSSAMNSHPIHSDINARSGVMPRQQQHVPSQQQRNVSQPVPRQAGSNGMRPFELRSDVPPQYNQHAPPSRQPQQQQQNRRPDLPVLQVTVPPQAHQPNHPNGRLPQQQQRYNQPAPFSSSAETLVGVSLYEKDKLYNGNNNGKPPNWSPSSSSGSSSSHHIAHGPQVPGTPRSPFVIAAGMGHHPNSPYGNPPSSPSIKNFKLQVPSTAEMTADSENDRLSPAMPRLRNGPSADSQRDWWKRFSTVVRENEQKEMLAEKTGGKGAKVQSEWLDTQAHRQRTYRIWVGVVAFIIIAAIAGGVAYHYVTKDKDSENAVTVPTTHGIEVSKSSDSASTAASVAASSVVLASPSAVPAGNNLGTRDDLSKRDVNDGLALPVKLLPARSLHAHAKRHQNLHHLD
ncbi:hypothetical protein P389DRAFT_2635 [Cystobasidium minutum MCA 4210]|uniref:uncharacterized protein n=1 Tax=Cystobasidium minutum MCA 4210 TaxID=1397322 RepID=UPI0034CEFB37|eukprot:jgi/Rhomi1/2635/CE2634_347